MRLATTFLAALLVATPVAAQHVALTFDDLPAHDPLPTGETHVETSRAILAALKAAGAPAIGFVNGARVEREPSTAEVLALWRKAGHPLGNHTWTHRRLTAADAAAFPDEVARNESLLKPLGRGWRWFRYPFLAEGDRPEVRAYGRQVLKARGYRVASVTLDFSDWAYNAPYARCRAKADAAAIAALEERFMGSAEASLDRARSLSQQLYGRDIPYVLLMHVGAFSARMTPRLLDLYAGKGVTFVSLETAEADPFYRADRELLPSPTPATLEDAARAGGINPPPAAGVEGLDQVCR